MYNKKPMQRSRSSLKQTDLAVGKVRRSNSARPSSTTSGSGNESNVGQRLLKVRKRSEERIAKGKKDRMAGGNSVELFREFGNEFSELIGEFGNTEVPVPSAHKQLKNRVTICARKRPLLRKEITNGHFDSIICSNPYVYILEGILGRSLSPDIKKHVVNLDHSFDEGDDNNKVYTSVCYPLLERLLNSPPDNGRNAATIFAYGQTSSGKTYTIAGLQYRIAADVFTLMPEGFTCLVSYFEVDGNELFDLLNEKQALACRENSEGETVIPGLMKVRVEDASDLLSLLEYGSNYRRTDSTNRNSGSSRTHAVCTLHFFSDTASEFGKFHFVDLAGSERANDALFHNKEQTNQMVKINRSLSALAECVRRVAEGKSARTAFRQSLLTMILKDCFANNKHSLTIIGCVTPSCMDVKHSLTTLRFLSRAKPSEKSETAVKLPSNWTKGQVNNFIRVLLTEYMKETHKYRNNPRKEEILNETCSLFNMAGGRFSHLTESEFLNICPDFGAILYEEINIVNLKMKKELMKLRKAPKKCDIEMHLVNDCVNVCDICNYISCEGNDDALPTSVNDGKKATLLAAKKYMKTRNYDMHFKIEDPDLLRCVDFMGVLDGRLVFIVPAADMDYFQNVIITKDYIKNFIFSMLSPFAPDDSGCIRVGNIKGPVARSTCVLLIQNDVD
ncbi:hypothetical protein PCE1_000329 [Barthelona sp. PCE]